MIWQQLKLDTTGELAGAVSEFLESTGAHAVISQSADGEDRFDLAEPTMQPWQSTRLTALYDDQQQLGPVIQGLTGMFDVTRDRISLEHLPDRDWERAWLENFKPLRISSNLWISPSWCTPPDTAAAVVTLDPGLAFGTGTHATTALCLEALSGLDLSGRRVIDYGCGSGILAIAALKLGAAEAIATDVDKKALDASLSNAQVNQVSDRLLILDAETAQREIEQDRLKGDVVIANILADALIGLMPTLSRALAKDGKLLLSGILAGQMESVGNAYEPITFTVHRQDDWIALLSRAC